MESDWRQSTWGDEISLEYGKALRGYCETQGHYRVFGSNGPIGWTVDALSTGPGVILGRKGAYRGVEYWRDSFWVIDTAYYVVPKSDLDMRWLYYAIKHYKLGEIDDGSPIPSTTRAAVYVRSLAVPPVGEQRAIAHILGTLDDKIEQNRKMNEMLEAIAKALFKSWFVDFDSIGPEDMHESEMGLIPKRWSVASLDYLATLVTKSISPAKYPDSIFEHYSIPAFDSGCIPVMESGQSIKSNKYVVLQDAILVSKLNPQTPRIWLPLLMSENAVCSTEFMQFVPRLKEYKPYLYCLMKSQYFQDEILKHVTGSTGSRQRAQPSQISSLSVLQPTTEILFEFYQQIDPILQRIGLNKLEEENLIKLRDALLPKLISGQLCIKNAEKFLESHI